MDKNYEFYYITGNIIDLVYLDEQKLCFNYRHLHEKFNVLCIKINDKFYSIDGELVFNDMEKNKFNKVKKSEIKKIVTKLGEYFVLKKVYCPNPTREEIIKGLKILNEKLHEQEEKSNLIGFPFENIGPIFKITNHKILEFPKK